MTLFISEWLVRTTTTSVYLSMSVVSYEVGGGKAIKVFALGPSLSKVPKCGMWTYYLAPKQAVKEKALGAPTNAHSHGHHTRLRAPLNGSHVAQCVPSSLSLWYNRWIHFLPRCFPLQQCRWTMVPWGVLLVLVTWFLFGQFVH